MIDGTLAGHFPLVVWQTGSGTQSNMNANEVIANRAIEMLGGEIGSKARSTPTTTVNMGQSSNDTFPTAMHIAAGWSSIGHELIPFAGAPAPGAGRQGARLRRDRQDRPHPSPGCHAPDARPGVFRRTPKQIEYGIDRVKRGAMPRLPPARPGRDGSGHRPQRQGRVSPSCSRIRSRRFTGFPFVTAENKFEALAAHDAIVEASGQVNVLAASCMKIANDIRLLGSGPRCGHRGAGPCRRTSPDPPSCRGKVNPTQSEAIDHGLPQIMGNHTTVTVAGSNGHYELNVIQAGDDLRSAPVDPADGRRGAQLYFDNCSWSGSRRTPTGSASCCTRA